MATCADYNIEFDRNLCFFLLLSQWHHKIKVLLLKRRIFHCVKNRVRKTQFLLIFEELSRALNNFHYFSAWKLLLFDRKIGQCAFPVRWTELMGVESEASPVWKISAWRPSTKHHLHTSIPIPRFIMSSYSWIMILTYGDTLLLMCKTLFQKSSNFRCYIKVCYIWGTYISTFGMKLHID